MVTGNILEESYRWQFTNSMLDCTLNCLIERRMQGVGFGKNGGLQNLINEGGGLENSKKFDSRGGVEKIFFDTIK